MPVILQINYNKAYYRSLKYHTYPLIKKLATVDRLNPVTPYNISVVDVRGYVSLSNRCGK